MLFAFLAHRHFLCLSIRISLYAHLSLSLCPSEVRTCKSNCSRRLGSGIRILVEKQQIFQHVSRPSCYCRQTIAKHATPNTENVLWKSETRAGYAFFQLRQLRLIRRSLDDDSVVTLLHTFVANTLEPHVGKTCQPWLQVLTVRLLTLRSMHLLGTLFHDCLKKAHILLSTFKRQLNTCTSRHTSAFDVIYGLRAAKITCLPWPAFSGCTKFMNAFWLLQQQMHKEITNAEKDNKVTKWLRKSLFFYKHNTILITQFCWLRSRN